MTKDEALKLFEMPKVVEYSELEIHERKIKTKARFGNFALEGSVPPDWYKVLAMEVARGETAQEEIFDCKFVLHKERLEKKVAEMAKYGLTPFDL